jgi:hypothetical protein
MWQLVADSFAGAGYPSCQTVGRMLAEIVIQPSSWYEKHGIHLIAGNGSAVRRSVGSAINKPIDVLSKFWSAKSVGLASTQQGSNRDRKGTC